MLPGALTNEQNYMHVHNCAHVRVHVHVHVPCMHMYMCRECVPELGNVRVVVAYVIIYFTCVTGVYLLPACCLLLLYLDLPADFIRFIASAQRQRRLAPETGESVSRTPVRVRRMFMHLMRPHCHPGRRTPPTSNVTLKTARRRTGGRSPAQHNVPQAAIHAQKSRGGGDAPHRAGGDNRRRRPAATPRARPATSSTTP